MTGVLYGMNMGRQRLPGREADYLRGLVGLRPEKLDPGGNREATLMGTDLVRSSFLRRHEALDRRHKDSERVDR